MSAGLRSGLDVIPCRGHIALVLVRSIKVAGGFRKGIDTDIQREPDCA
jgi:hypothetical protein